MVRIGIVLIVILGALALWVNLRHADGPPEALRDFPHAYLAPEDMGYDPDQVVIVRSDGIDGSDVVTVDGKELWPVYFHPDPEVIPRKDGQVYLLPMRFFQDQDNFTAEPVPTTPPLPHTGEPLDHHTAYQLERYLVPEARERLEQVPSLDHAAPGDPAP